jgi:hypothetical protein
MVAFYQCGLRRALPLRGCPTQARRPPLGPQQVMRIALISAGVVVLTSA